jgi:hypothetical protein
MDGTSKAEEIPESFTVRLTPNGRKDLATIADKLGVTLGEALGRAIGMEAFLVEEDENQTEVWLKDTKGTWRPLPVRKRGENAGNGRHG